MKKLTFFLILFLLISCKERNQKITFQTPKLKSTVEAKIISIDSTRIASFKDSLVVAFYKANNNKTFWIGDTFRLKILPIINDVAAEGLFQKDFDAIKLHDYEKRISSLSDAHLIAYDVLLTQNLSRYVQKVAKGSLKPRALYDNWDLKENAINYKNLLLGFQQKDSFAIALKAIYPKHPIYIRLREALQIIKSYPKEEYKMIVFDSKLVLNDTNVQLVTIKNKLIYWKDLTARDSITAIYDQETAVAVKKFQVRHGLNPDGVIGKGILQALNVSKEKREQQIIANMERWRWYPREFEENYILINIPDYSLFALEQKDTTLICKIVVGKPKRMTPVLSSKFSYLVFNPTWTIPPTILEKDIIPAILRDSSYLRKKNITVYDSDNQIIDSISWDVNKADTYRYVQSLGAYNALGKVKFIFSNRFTIYLHDTNSRSYFSIDNRALSSGCIRVQNPLKLAAYVLDNPKKWGLKQIRDTIKKGKTKPVTIHKEVYLHILYWTAWSKDGTLQFRNDLYNLDAALYQKLSK